ncbi:hypothetical protein GH975_01625 [Litorivicinus lipolyticus]|uniref:SPOR domain-containing protein n=1 Tax=Litorivicinus lipolyticus TaxID=418701 RepID=A0A5Q2QBX8_9GAMM|nr:SPOR domain-containing protein [Litorivicinus lipolyticus]QGG79330.1 hypothetical protein GH975_01625 [Litorivicinus lipolyticus]
MSALVGSGARAQSVLEHWLRFDPGVAELVAPSGMGKSAVAKALGGDDVRLIRISAPIKPDVLLAALTRQLGVAGGDLRASLIKIRKQARTARGAGFHTLIVVDRAEHADDAVLALLGRIGLAAADGDGIAVLLLASTSQRARLTQVSHQGARFDDISLVPLNDDEADELISAHLHDGPWQGDGLAALDRAALIAAAAGNPGRLLAMLANKRNGLPLVARTPAGRKRVMTVFGIGLVLAFGLTGAWVWQWHSESGVAPLPAAADAAEPAGTRDLLAEVEAQIQAPLAEPPAPAPLAEESFDFAGALPAPAAAVELDRLMAEWPQPVLASAPAPVIVSAPVTVPEVAPVSSLVVFAPAPTAPASNEVAAASVQVRPSAADEAKILSSSAASFTLQLFGTRDLAAASNQKNRLPSSIDGRIAEVIHQGNPWFVLVAGDYRTREDAEAASRGLPANVIEQGFWIRSFEGLQNQIREARR